MHFGLIDKIAKVGVTGHRTRVLQSLNESKSMSHQILLILFFISSL